jgi:hypothetical protein
MVPHFPMATVLLMCERECPIRFESLRQSHDFSSDATVFEKVQRPARLLPLACALSGDETQPVAPRLAWQTVLVPFFSVNGWSSPLDRGFGLPSKEIDHLRADLERWSSIVEDNHNSSVDVEARRIVSAISGRFDRSDSLIDAVTAWENIVGSSSETSRLVTTSLARLLEPDVSMRDELYRRLRKIYDQRSRVVHGELVKPELIETMTTEAIAFGLKALRVSYRKGSSWLALTSEQRATQTLLG